MTAESTAATKVPALSPEAGKDYVVCPNTYFAGFESPTGYSPNDLEALRRLHNRVAEQHRISSPYYKYTNKGEPILMRVVLNAEQRLILKAGSIGSFTEDQVAVFLQEQARNYVHKDTMGEKFPRGDVELEEELLAMFMDSFKPEDVMIMVQSERNGQVEIIGGARIVRGTTDKPLAATSYVGSPEQSTLPTFSALQLKHSSDELETPLKHTEAETACITRYWRQDNDMLKVMQLRNNAVPLHIIAAMPIAYTLDSIRRHEGHKRFPKQAVFDTHRMSIMDTVRDMFGAVKIADNGNIFATDEVMETVLRYHYGSQEKYGGYENNIVIGMFDTPQFLSKAIAYFKRVSLDIETQV